MAERLLSPRFYNQLSRDEQERLENTPNKFLSTPLSYEPLMNLSMPANLAGQNAGL